MTGKVELVGYATPLVVHPGGTVELKLSSAAAADCVAEVVRLTCCDADPGSPGLRYVTVVPRMAVRVTPQRTHPGSCIVVEPAPRPSCALSLAMLIAPTRADLDRQTVMAHWDPRRRAGFVLSVTQACGLELQLGDGAGALQAVSIGRPIGPSWHLIGASIDPDSGRVLIFQRPFGRAGIAGPGDAASAALTVTATLPDTPLLIGAVQDAVEPLRAADHFNGRIERPAVFSAALGRDVLEAYLTAAILAPPASCLACWDFAREIPTTRVVDMSGHGHDGRTVNLPARGVTGAFWSGRSNEWWHAPEQYGAIHFHDDDIHDCGWETALRASIPEDAKSGFYAAKIESNEGEHKAWVPFFVSAASRAPTGRIALLAPTCTYLAYANSHIKVDHPNSEALFERLLTLTEVDLFLNAHREIGLSLYDTHTDGSGVFYSSALRPILNIGPGPSSREYVNDSLILAWLEAQGFAYDVITDEDVHRDGAALLQRYAVLITVTHPEYYSTRMLDAVEAFQARGGRHMYLGGNGFYWRIALADALPGVIENRRGFAGMRTWEGEPGEEGLSLSAEPGGIWRHLGRAPQRLVGVGFCASVFDRYGYYRRRADSEIGRFVFVFDGVSGETFGRRAIRNDGAVGFEIDRWERGLGSPADGVILATSEGLGPGALLSVEEMITTTRAIDAEQNAQVRADMVIFATPGGGAVWSTGSVAWAQSLAVDEDASRITRNVLVRFLDPAPL